MSDKCGQRQPSLTEQFLEYVMLLLAGLFLVILSGITGTALSKEIKKYIDSRLSNFDYRLEKLENK